MRRILTTTMVALLTWIAGATMASASGLVGYQAEVPKALRK